MTRRISEAEAKNINEALARRNPELWARMNAEFEAMSDEELLAVAYPCWAPPKPAHGFDESSLADRYGAEDRKAKYQAACEAADEAATKATNEADKLRLSWYELDRFIEAGCEDDLFDDREEELWRPIFDRLKEVEQQIADMIPASLGDCLLQLRVLKSRWAAVPDEVDDQLVENLLAGVEAMATAAG
jgi:hypothetical protein